MTIVDITNHCNLRCKYYYAHNDCDIHVLPCKVIEIVRPLHKMGVWQIVLGGGELFLHPDTIDILRAILEHNNPIGVVSNGTILPRHHIHALIRLNKSYPKLLLYIQVSLDSVNHSINDRLRGDCTQVLKTRHQLSAHNISVITITVLHKYNAASGHEIVPALYPTIRKFHFMDLMPSHAVIRSQEDYFADRKYVAETFSMLRVYQKKYKDVIITYPDFKSVLSEKYLPTLRCDCCTAAITRMDITAQGVILACNIADRSAIGNIYRDSIDSTWRSKRADAYRREVVPLCHKSRILNREPHGRMRSVVA